MRKKTIKLGGIIFAVCLSVLVPVCMTVPMVSYAAGSTVSTTVDITPPTGTADVRSYIETKIQTALTTNNTIMVSGSAEINDTSSASINIKMAQGQKIIWNANLKGNLGLTMLMLDTMTAGEEAEFELAGGSLISDGHVVLEIGHNNKIKLKISGGEIIKRGGNDVAAVYLGSEGGLVMSGGRVINYADSNAAFVINPSGDAQYNITGGTIAAIGDSVGTDLRTGNSAISVVTPPGLLADVNIDEKKANIISWDRHTYNTQSPVIRYVGGGYDERHLHKYPNSSVKLSWTKVNGTAAVKYENPNGDSGIIMQEAAAVDDINFQAIPANLVYDKSAKGLDSLQTADGSDVVFTYEGINGTNYPASSQKPVNAGEYKVRALLSQTYGSLNAELGVMKIDKRAITIKVADQSITKGTLPRLPQSFADFSIENLANGDRKEDALNAVPSFTWNTDGSTEGYFNIGTLSPISYSDNYMASAQEIEGMLTVGTPATPRPSAPKKATPSNPSKKATPSNPSKPSGNNNSRNNNSRNNSSRRRGNTSSKNKKRKAAKKKQTGAWMQDNKGWWYKEADGSYPKSKWMELNYNSVNRWYYFDEDGYMATGWKLIDGKWYYLYERTEGLMIKGAMANNTRIDGYYVGSDGAWVK